MKLIKCDSCDKIIAFSDKYVKLKIEIKYLSAVDRYSMTNDNDTTESLDICMNCFNNLVHNRGSNFFRKLIK